MQKLASTLRRFSTKAHTTPSTAAAEAPVLFNQHGSAVTVLLNRPKAMNSLNLDMVRLMQHEVNRWQTSDSVAAIILKGAGGKAFCAGGDIKTLYDGRDNADTAAKQEAFFREEYTLDNALAKSSTHKPHVAIYDGTVMGGGVGISINATFRIATEKTLFAMPETGIGLFPDVGGSFFLPRLSNHFGVFLALTGHRLKGADVVHAGVATHFVSSDKLEQVEAEIAAIPAGPQFGHAAPAAAINNVLSRHAAPLPAPTMQAEQLVVINKAFSKRSMEEIVAELKTAAGAGSDVAAQSVKSLSRMSPTSLKVTLEQMIRGATLSLEDCYKMELRMALRFMQGTDFYEGVRALLVDKDNAPKWKPADLGSVSKEAVEAYFAPLPAAQELILH